MKKLITYEDIDYYYKVTYEDFETNTHIYILNKFKLKNVIDKIFYILFYKLLNLDYKRIFILCMNVESTTYSKEIVRKNFKLALIQYKLDQIRKKEIENNEFI